MASPYVLQPSFAPYGELLQKKVDTDRQNELYSQQQAAHQEQERLRIEQQEAAQKQRILSDFPKIGNSSNLDIKAARDKFIQTNMSRLLSNIKSYSPIELQQEIQKLQPQFQVYDHADKLYDQTLKGLKEQHKDLKGVYDYNDALKVVNNQFSEDFFDYKNGGEVKTDARPRNYLEELFKPENLANINVNIEPLATFIAKGIPGSETFKDNKIKDYKGNVVQKQISGTKTPFTEGVIGADGKMTMQLIGGVVPDQLKQMIVHNPINKLILDKLVLNKKVEQNDPRKEGELYEETLKQFVTDFIPKEVNEVNVEKTPKDRIININTGDGYSKNPGSDFVDAFETAAKNKDLNAIKEALGLLYVGNTAYSIPDLDKVEIKGNKLIFAENHKYIHPETGDAADESSIKEFDLDDPNLRTKTAGAWQKYTGSDAKIKGVGGKAKSTQPTKQKAADKSGGGWKDRAKTVPQ